MRFISGLIDHFRAADEPGPLPEDSRSRHAFRDFLLLLSVWMFIWTLLPSSFIGNIPIDVAENIAWGQKFAFGYDKNPYFGAWLTASVFEFLRYDWVFYLMSQLAVSVGLTAAYLLTFEVTRSRFAAFIAGASSLLIPVFSNSAKEFNDDMMSVALWGLTALSVWRAVRGGKIGAYLAAGFFAGAAAMTKYLAGALLLSLGVLFFATREGRAAWKKPGLYLGIAVFLVLTAPNLVWLFEHDFITVHYAFGRADFPGGMSLSGHIVRPLDFMCSFFSRLLVPVAAIMLFRRSRRGSADGFGRVLLWCVGVGPFALSLAFAVVTGGDVLNSWMKPYYVFAMPLLVTEYCPMPEPRPLKRFAALFVLTTAVMALCFGYEYLYKRPYRKRGGYNVYPGRRIAGELTERWRRRFGRPLPYVIGNRRSCCYVRYYSPDHPKVFFDHDLRVSPPIDPADVAKRGAVVIWQGGTVPPYLKNHPRRTGETIALSCELAVPRWLRAVAGPPDKVEVRAEFIAPEE